MAIVDVRIDDRLIHGQVISYWIPALSVERIVIIDDKIAGDEVRMATLKFGCPGKIKLAIITPKSAAEKFKAGLDEGSRVMILCTGPDQLVQLAEAGFVVDTITVGNISTREAAVKIKRNMFVTPQQKADFKKLATMGVKLFYQNIPGDAKEDLTATVADF